MLFLNISLALMLLCTTHHVLVFYLLYEVTTFLILPMLTTSSRSIRKGFALTTLYMVITLGLLAYLLLIILDVLESTDTSHHDWARSNLLLVSLLVIILTKTPTYPVMFWLPEAHVESTWVGSSILACIVLKYSIFACLMFATSSSAHGLTSLQWYLASFTLAWCVLAILPQSDLKRLGALLSIVHMNAAVLSIMVSGYPTSLALTDMWLSHSILALLWFYWVGICYSSAGSRSIIAAPHPDTVLINGLITLCLLILMIFSPYGPLATPEFQLCSHLTWETSILTWALLHYYLVLLAVIIGGLVLSISSAADMRAILLDLGLSSLTDFLLVGLWLTFPWPW